MRNWQTVTGAALWVVVATLMMSAALQPVGFAAARHEGMVLVSLCADGSSNLAMGCESIHL
jgi:hypothetical protein